MCLMDLGFDLEVITAHVLLGTHPRLQSMQNRVFSNDVTNYMLLYKVGVGYWQSAFL